MKALKYSAAAALLVPALAGTAAAQTQSVSYEVQAINVISLSGSPSLVISAASAGLAPTRATATGTYAITTNEASKKITAQINATMPDNVTLTIDMNAPSASGLSAGPKALSTTPVDVVTGITRVNETGLTVTYHLDATVAAGKVSTGSRTVTFTIAAGA